MNYGWLSVGVIAACSLSFALGWGAGSSSAESDYALSTATAEKSYQTDVADAERNARIEEIRRNEVIKESDDRAHQSTLDSAVAGVGADDAAARLRVELQNSKRRFESSQASCDTRVEQQRNSARAQYDMLARLYQESDEAAGRLAAEAEGYRIAGVACNSQFNGIRNQIEDRR